ncbi:hypothetical protein M3O39_00005, partial [Xanthomonas nasturtii]|uniref:hypothetical protein n=1 Tax=Xanthomonas nasturtii TaxID=1843581 RepID=UPI0020118975
MPKPYFLRRPAGLYVRFFVPTDLQALIGSRYLVRPVHLSLGDAARLAVVAPEKPPSSTKGQRRPVRQAQGCPC